MSGLHSGADRAPARAPRGAASFAVARSIRILRIASLGLSSATPALAARSPETSPAATASSGPTSAAAPVESGAHRHDGFYLRLGLGFSGFGDGVESSARLNDESRDAGSVHGVAVVSELAIGGTVARGFVLGGGVYGASVASSSFEQIRGGAIPDELRSPNNFSVTGVMADWYFEPKNGFHVQAALGLASLSGVGAETLRFQDRRVALGGGAMVGFGYEWWVADEWGIGILGRATLGVAAEDDDQGDRWLHFVAASPSILFSATYH